VPPVSNGSVAQQNQGSLPDGSPTTAEPVDSSPVIAEQQHDDALAALAGEAAVISAVDAAPGAHAAPVAPPPRPAGVPSTSPASPPEPMFPPGPGASRGAALAEAARAEAEERTRRAAEAHAARTAARAAAEAEAAEAAEAVRSAAVERSRAAAAAHTSDAVEPDDIVPGFAPTGGGSHPHVAAHDQVGGLRRSRRPAVGLVALVVLGFVAAFFGWVSADPFWLGTGQGATGTVTVARCDAGRCEGQFAGTAFSAEGVLLSGISPADRQRGATVPARMLASDRDWAYAGPAWGLHLRWALGLTVVVLCGLALGAATGARFLRPLGRRASVGARLLALAGPLALFAGMLGAALV
jgi:hypothetical protein